MKTLIYINNFVYNNKHIITYYIYIYVTFMLFAYILYIIIKYLHFFKTIKALFYTFTKKNKV